MRLPYAQPDRCVWTAHQRQSSRTVTPGLFILFTLLACAFAQAADAGPLHTPTWTQPGAMPRMQIQADGQVVDLPLQGTHIHAEISGPVARVHVIQTFENTATDPMEVLYRFKLPERSAVSEATLQLRGRTIRAEIHEREKAKQIYEAARARGQTAGLLTQLRSNVFNWQLTHIPPGETLQVTVTYEQRLMWEAGMREFVFPMAWTPHFNGDQAAPGDRSPWQPPTLSRVPLVTQGPPVSLDLILDGTSQLEDLVDISHKVELTSDGDTDALYVSLSPDPAHGDRDFVLRWSMAEDQPSAKADVHQEGHFALSVMPPAGNPDDLVGKRELIFVIDVSGSMYGDPLRAAQGLVVEALERMRPDDTFNILTFAGRTSSLFPEPQAVNEPAINAARRFVLGTTAGGGTRLGDAIDAALSQHDAQPQRRRHVVFLTDGQVGGVQDILRRTERLVATYDEAGSVARVFMLGVGYSVNRQLMHDLSEAGRGIGRVHTLAEDPRGSIDAVFTVLDHPIMESVTIDWGGLPVTDVVPEGELSVFATRPLVITGRLTRAAKGVVTIKGRQGWQRVKIKVPVHLDHNTPDRPALGSLWARDQIAALVRARWTAASEDSKRLTDQIRELGLSHHLVTSETSLVAVDTEGHVPGRLMTVQQPSVRARGVSMGRVASAGVHKSLGTSLQGQGPLKNVFGDKTGFDSKLNAAMSGIGDGLAVGAGAGGMGMRGTGGGGGGYGFGRIHGMGRIDTGGGRGVRARRGDRGKKRKKPRVKRGKPTFNGLCRQSDVIKKVQRRIQALKYCYEKELQRTPGLQGKVILSWRIGLDGKVRKVDIESSSLSNAAVEGCMKYNIARWRFSRLKVPRKPAKKPPVPGNACEIHYPFVFSSGL